MGIHIGDDNNISNAKIINNENYAASKESNEKQDIAKKNFFEKHPVLTSIGISLFVGILLMFSFWDSLIQWIESLL